MFQSVELTVLQMHKSFLFIINIVICISLQESYIYSYIQKWIFIKEIRVSHRQYFPFPERYSMYPWKITISEVIKAF